MQTCKKAGTPEYEAWTGMLQRVKGKKAKADYFDRGITCCDRWLKFENFMADMGRRPGPGFSLERKDNNKGYSSDNCCWATRAEQNRNKRNNVNIAFNGKTQCMAEWAREIGISVPILHYRLKAGWPIEKALAIISQDILLTFNGKTQSVIDWARELGMNKNALYKRLRAGWPPYRALSTPVKAEARPVRSSRYAEYDE